MCKLKLFCLNIFMPFFSNHSKHITHWISYHVAATETPPKSLQHCATPVPGPLISSCSTEKGHAVPTTTRKTNCHWKRVSQLSRISKVCELSPLLSNYIPSQPCNGHAESSHTNFITSSCKSNIRSEDSSCFSQLKTVSWLTHIHSIVSITGVWNSSDYSISTI